MATAEIELKFTVKDTSSFLHHALSVGFTIQTPRTFERNALFDTPDRRLRQEKQLLRIRQYGPQWRVTHKRPPSQAEEDSLTGYKFRYETETTVEDGEAMGAIFVELGLRPVFRYEKFRTELEDSTSSGHLVLDETPIGTFAELEGDPAWIEDTLVRLNISPAECFTDSYGRLFLDWKARTNSPAENLTFDEVGTLASV